MIIDVLIMYLIDFVPQETVYLINKNKKKEEKYGNLPCTESLIAILEEISVNQ